MPKTRNTVKGARGVKARSLQIPFKLGGRKSVKSALRMSTEELLQEYNRGGVRGRDKNKIQQVLHKRGITDFSLPEEE